MIASLIALHFLVSMPKTFSDDSLMRILASCSSEDAEKEIVEKINHELETDEVRTLEHFDFDEGLSSVQDGRINELNPFVVVQIPEASLYLYLVKVHDKAKEEDASLLRGNVRDGVAALDRAVHKECTLFAATRFRIMNPYFRPKQFGMEDMIKKVETGNGGL